MKIITPSVTAATDPAVGQKKESTTEIVGTVTEISVSEAPSTTERSLMFTLILELPIAKKPLLQIKQITDSQLFSEEIHGAGQMGDYGVILGKLDEIELKINGCYLGHGMLLALDGGWGLRVTHLAQQTITPAEGRYL